MRLSKNFAMSDPDSDDVPDLHDEIDAFALEIERRIAETQQFLEELPEFRSRSNRSKKLRRVQHVGPNSGS